jgi:hypothetical protein
LQRPRATAEMGPEMAQKWKINAAILADVVGGETGIMERELCAETATLVLKLEMLRTKVNDGTKS